MLEGGRLGASNAYLPRYVRIHTCLLWISKIIHRHIRPHRQETYLSSDTQSPAMSHTRTITVHNKTISRSAGSRKLQAIWEIETYHTCLCTHVLAPPTKQPKVPAPKTPETLPAEQQISRQKGQETIKKNAYTACYVVKGVLDILYVRHTMP